MVATSCYFSWTQRTEYPSIRVNLLLGFTLELSEGCAVTVTSPVALTVATAGVLLVHAQS